MMYKMYLCITSPCTVSFLFKKPVILDFLRHITGRRFIDPIREKELPVFVYAGKNPRPHNHLYLMGVSLHGALGITNLLRPKHKHTRVYHYMHRPFRIPFAEVHDILDVACGYGFTVITVKGKDTHSCFGTGLTSDCQIGLITKGGGKILECVLEPYPIPFNPTKSIRAKKVSCGRAHTIITTDDGGVWTFGNNAYGQCGRKIVENESYTTRVHFNRVELFNKKEVTQIVCGQDSSFVLSEGKVYSCGWSADGQSGRNTFSNVDNFDVVEGDLKGQKVIKVSSSGDCVLALTDSGEVFAWGNSEYRQLEMITRDQQVSTPTHLPLKMDGKIVDIATSGTACYIVTDSGELWSWGYGMLGRGPNNSISSKPEQIPSTLLGRTVLSKDCKVTEVVCGLSMAAALNSDGNLFTWGLNKGGCLGLGHLNYQYFPMRVCVAGKVLKVSCGVDHFAVIAQGLI